MRLALVSGKGGTGKTFLASSLARAWSEPGQALVLADADVEGPNADRFLPGLTWEGETEVTVPTPSIVEARCDLCGACEEACRFHALVTVPGQRMVFVPSLCHSCGACRLVCPRQAIEEVPRAVGTLRTARAGDVRLVQGVATIGEERATPAIAATLERAHEVAEAAGRGDVLVDGPPGAACPTVEVAGFADACLIVTEPTPFGLHDLQRVHALLEARNKPVAVAINRSRGVDADRAVREWCESRGLPIVLEIPDRRELAEAYAAGTALIDADPWLLGPLRTLREQMASWAGGRWSGREVAR
jgi:MinD superfamily P-loop ATPase